MAKLLLPRHARASERTKKAPVTGPTLFCARLRWGLGSPLALFNGQIGPNFAAGLGSGMQVGVYPAGQQGGGLGRAQDAGAGDGRFVTGAGRVVERKR